ncbi:N-acetylserotonin O-methyltransferase-like protein, partial [Blattella germanica]
ELQSLLKKALDDCKSLFSQCYQSQVVDSLLRPSMISGKMLEPVMHILQSQRIILASGSPRREEILRVVGLKFEVCPSLYEEDLDPSKYKNHGDFVVDTATNKVKEVVERLSAGDSKPDIVIGADTMVSMDGKVLVGRCHSVFTGVVLHNGTDLIKFSERTDVYMAPVSEEVIRAYVKTGEPLDKAGAYGIQGIGGSLVQKIEGDYFNVMGMPLHKVCSHLVEITKSKK